MCATGTRNGTRRGLNRAVDHMLHGGLVVDPGRMLDTGVDHEPATLVQRAETSIFLVKVILSIYHVLVVVRVEVARATLPRLDPAVRARRERALIAHEEDAALQTQEAGFERGGVSPSPLYMGEVEQKLVLALRVYGCGGGGGGARRRRRRRWWRG